MRIDRVKLIAEMARQSIRAQDLADKACVSRCTIVALRGGKSCTENSGKPDGAVSKIHCFCDSISSIFFDVRNPQQKSIFEVGIPL